MFSIIGYLLLYDTVSLAEETIVVEEKREKKEQALAKEQVDIAERSLSNGDLGELLQQVSGVYIRRFGGMGDYTSLSIRGASSQQSTIFINGIPLNPDGSTTLNLTHYPVQAFSKMAVYRSHTPLELQNSSIGGAINLIPEQENQQQLLVGGGSFQTGIVQGLIGAKYKEHQLQIFGRGLYSTADFEYFDDNATIYNVADDQLRERSNNQKEQGNLFFYDQWKELSLIHNSSWQQEGLAGHVNMLFEAVSLSGSQHLSAIQWKKSFYLYQQKLNLWHIVQNNILDDQEAEITGVALWQKQSFRQLGIQNHQQWIVSDYLYPALSQSIRWEEAKTLSLLDEQETTNNQRLIGKIQLGNQSLFMKDWENITALNLHVLSVFDADPILFVAPQSSLLFRGCNNAILWASFQQGFRPPTMLELYGNRGGIVGNPALKPERSLNVDGGVSFQLKEKLAGQVAGFSRWGTDDIIFIQNAQKTSIPSNFTKTQTQGIEASISVEPIEHFTINSGITWIHSVNQTDVESLSGKRLPNVPMWQSSQNISWQNAWYALQYNWIFVDKNYWDATNLYRSTPRSFHNVELSLNGKQKIPSVHLELRNINNRITEKTWIDPLQQELGYREQMISDFQGYPLPGRNIVMSVEWKTKGKSE